MMGLKEVFSRVNYGAMAVAIGEKCENNLSRRLWLFRDEERPLHVVDMRKTLGQIFFCSTAEIWKSAVESCPSVKDYIPADQVIIEFPAYQVWMLGLDHGTPVSAGLEAAEPAADVPVEDTWTIKKFRITKTKFYDWKQEDDDNVKISRSKAKPTITVVSRLDNGEEVVKDKSEKSEKTETSSNIGPVPNIPTKKKITSVNTRYVDQEGDVDEGSNSTDEDYLARYAASGKDDALDELSPTTIESPEIDMKQFDDMVKDLRGLIDRLETSVKNASQENSISEKDFSVVIDSLKDAQGELKGSLVFLKA